MLAEGTPGCMLASAHEPVIEIGFIFVFHVAGCGSLLLDDAATPPYIEITQRSRYTGMAPALQFN